MLPPGSLCYPQGPYVTPRVPMGFLKNVNLVQLIGQLQHAYKYICMSKRRALLYRLTGSPGFSKVYIIIDSHSYSSRLPELCINSFQIKCIALPVKFHKTIDLFLALVTPPPYPWVLKSKFDPIQTLGRHKLKKNQIQ